MVIVVILVFPEILAILVSEFILPVRPSQIAITTAECTAETVTEIHVNSLV